MAEIDYDLVTALYVPTHRAPKNVPLDKVRSHGMPHQPRHCACQDCRLDFLHQWAVRV